MTLTELTPASVGADVCDLLAAHLVRVAAAIAPPERATPGATDLAESALARAARDLTLFALTGTAQGVFPDVDAARALVVNTLTLVPWGRLPSHSQATPIEHSVGPCLAPRSTPVTSIGLVLLAVAARQKLAAGVVPSTRELAALCGARADGTVTAIVSRGDLKLSDVSAVREWLQRRGVTGL